ncbi:MAG: hypothetical protein ACPG44_07850, partial [Polaribacter sp.]
MQVTITENEEKNAIELLFSENLLKEFSTFLLELGFREVLKKKNIWYADVHPAYKSFATSLRDAFSRGEDWETVSVYPSFQPSLENIDKSKFSFVSISYRGAEKAETKDYVLFDPYKKVATEIANQYAIAKYGDDLQNIEVSPRNYKRKARILYDNGQIINRIKVEEQTEKENEPAKEVENDLPIEESETETEEPTEEVTTENDSGYKTDKERQISTREILNEVIGKLAILEDRLEGEDETIIATTILDLEDAAQQSSNLRFKNELLKALQNFKDWIFDLTFSTRTMALMEINRLNQSLELPFFYLKEDAPKTLSVPKDIFNRDHIVPNVLVPNKAGEPFQSGGLNLSDANFMRMKFKRLYNITDETIDQASGLDLFRLSQMAHPNDYGISVNRSTVLREWESRGSEAFEEIGYPTDLDYPYVNVHAGYKSVSTLASQIGAYDDRHQWWSAVEHSRPIADLAKGIVIMDSLLMELVEKKLELVNPKTNKPKT